MGDFDWDGEVEEAWRQFRRRLSDAVFDLGDNGEIYLVGPRADVHVHRLGDSLVLGRYGDIVAGGIETTETVALRECDHVAARVVTQLRGSGALHPALVDGDTWETVPAVPLPRSDDPEPELIRPETPDELQAAVDRALTPLVGGEVSHDDDGDIPIVAGQSMLFVRVDRGCPRVDLFCELVWDIRQADQVSDVVAELTNTYVYQFATDDDRILLRYSLPAWPFVPEQLRDFLTTLLDRLDDMATTTARRLDALRFLDEPRPEDVPVAPVAVAPRELIDPELAGLVEALHVGRLEPGEVAAHFGDDRSAIANRIVQVRVGAPLCPDDMRETVIDHLRLALHHLIERAAADRRRPRSRQLSLLPDLEHSETFGDSSEAG